MACETVQDGKDWAHYGNLKGILPASMFDKVGDSLRIISPRRS